MKPNGNRIADRDLFRRAQKVPRGVGRDRVAAFQDLQRPALLQLQTQPLYPFTLCSQHPFRFHAKLSASFLYPQPHRCDTRTKVKTGNSQMR